MTKLKNASPDEIREYFNGTNVRWVDTFNDNNVPDDIILEFKNRIFKGDCYSRVCGIVDMMVNNNRKMPDEIFNIAKSKIEITHINNIDKVYDMISYMSSLGDDDMRNIGYFATNMLEISPNLPLEFVKLVLNDTRIHAKHKHVAVRKMLSNKDHKMSNEVHEYVFNYMKNNYYQPLLNSAQWNNGFIEKSMFTAKEFVSMVEPENIILFFDHHCTYNNGIHKDYHGKDILNSPFNTPEIVEIVVQKLLDYIDSEKSSTLNNNYWNTTRILIKDHPMFEKIFDALASQHEIYSRKDVSWLDADNLISIGKMKSDIVELLLLRLDAPLWFTDKYQSKILQLIAIKSKMKNYDNSFLEHFYNKCNNNL